MCFFCMPLPWFGLLCVPSTWVTREKEIGTHKAGATAEILVFGFQPGPMIAADCRKASFGWFASSLDLEVKKLTLFKNLEFLRILFLNKLKKWALQWREAPENWPVGAVFPPQREEMKGSGMIWWCRGESFARSFPSSCPAPPPSFPHSLDVCSNEPGFSTWFVFFLLPPSFQLFFLYSLSLYGSQEFLYCFNMTSVVFFPHIYIFTWKHCTGLTSTGIKFDRQMLKSLW